MLNLNLRYFGHLMWRIDSLEKTLMLGKIEGRRRRGWQRMRWLDGITDSMDREAWCAAVQSWTWLNNWTELDWTEEAGGGRGNPLQCSCLEDPVDRGAWLATVHRVTKTRTWLKQLSTHARKQTASRWLWGGEGLGQPYTLGRSWGFLCWEEALGVSPEGRPIKRLQKSSQWETVEAWAKESWRHVATASAFAYRLNWRHARKKRTKDDSKISVLTKRTSRVKVF